MWFFCQGDRDHPICPVLLGEAKLASAFADGMLGKIFQAYSSLIQTKLHNLTLTAGPC